MSLAVSVLEPARATVPGRSTWWSPARVAIHEGHWKTVHYPKYTAVVRKGQTLAVSPVGIDGMAHFVAFDIDSGDEGDVQAVLKALPQGTVPLVSHSGKKGWHVWLFPSAPIPVKTALAFGRWVLERSAVSCEVFPTGKNSRCLKWPGSPHPETKKPEVFVPIENVAGTPDTDATLQALADGLYRTPADLFERRQSCSRQDRGFPEGVSYTHMGYNDPIAENNTRTATAKGRSLAMLPELAFGLAELAGRRVTKMGKPFRCILPGHEERKPSAEFYVGDNGTVVYHDWHASKHGTPEFLTLGEMYHAIATGRIAKLRPVDSARWLARLALRLGIHNEQTKQVRSSLDRLSQILLQSSVLSSPVGCKTRGADVSMAKGEIISSFVLLPPPALPEEKNRGKGNELTRVWQAFCDEAMVSAMNGFNEVKLSKRFLARIADVPDDVANRAMNLLSVLGVLEKAPGSGGERGDRFVLGDPSARKSFPFFSEEVQRRWEALGKPSLRQFKKTLVEERLGPEIANAVFRRSQKENELPSAAEKTVQVTDEASVIRDNGSTKPYNAPGDVFLGEEYLRYGQASQAVSWGFLEGSAC
ncbi:MAG: hypothetical protein HPY55_07230 [Firmicutes bacterium]|nr:hypothetical protein [Bacillota bacterium]